MDGNTVVSAVRQTRYTVGADGVPVPKSIDRFELTMVKINGKWLMSNFTNVGLV